MDSLNPSTLVVPAEDKLIRTLERLALGFALVVAIGLPGAYFGLQYTNHAEHVVVSAKLTAKDISALATADPMLWASRVQPLQQMLGLHPPWLDETDEDDMATVRDAAGKVLSTVGSPLSAPVMIRSEPVYSSGQVVGRVEIAHSYRNVVFAALLVSLFGLLFGGAVYSTLLFLPLRALRRMRVALLSEQAARSVREDRFRLLFNRASDGIMVLSLTGKIFEVNESFARMHGYRVEEMLNMSLTDLDTLETLRHVPERMQGIRSGESISFEVEHYHRDGHIFPIEVTISLIVAGGETLIQAFHRDISKRRQAENELRAAEEQFRGLVEQSIAGIYIIQDGKFAYVNPRFAEIRGFSTAEELIGLDPLPMVAEKDRSTIKEINLSLLAGEKRDVNFSFTALRKDGSCIEVGVHSSRASYHGRPAIIGLQQDISEKKRAEEAIQHYITQLKTAFMSTVEVATVLSELRDPYTAGHERRVGEIAVAIGTEFGLDTQRLEGLMVAGYLHDIGKIIIPSEILSKPGKLGTIEYQLIQGHVQASYDVLKSVEWPWPVAEAVLQHHERMDGSGYPQGLKGDEILLEARILAVADVVEAMSSHRPYRSGLGIEAALAEIEHGRGSSYDVAIVDACLRLFREKAYALPEPIDSA
ncbi:MAG: PAS domain S-box protein [Georgfuchsia sp.]